MKNTCQLKSWEKSQPKGIFSLPDLASAVKPPQLKLS